MDNVCYKIEKSFQNPPEDDYLPARIHRGSAGNRAVGSTTQTARFQFQETMWRWLQVKSVFKRMSHAIGITPVLNACSSTIRQPSNGEIREILAAIKNNDVNKIQEMILSGIDLDATNFDQDRPIYEIISQNRTQLIELLISMNVFDANVDSSECCGMIEINVALVLAVKKQRFEILKLLITHVNSSQNLQESIQYQDIFDVSVSCGNTKITKLLIENTPFKINYLYGWGQSALMTAIAKQDCEMAKLLIDHGADVNLPDKINCSPLERAVRSCNQDITELLLQNGAKREKFTLPAYFLGGDELFKARRDALIDQINSLKVQPESLKQLSTNAIKKVIVEDNGKITQESSIASLLEGLCMPRDEDRPKILLKSVTSPNEAEDEDLKNLKLLKCCSKEEIIQALPEGATLRDIIPQGIELDYGVTEEAIYIFLRENGEAPRLIYPREVIDYNSID